MKELAIGEIGEIDGVKVRCVEDIDSERIYCLLCAVFVSGKCPLFPCFPHERTDGRDVHFEEVES